MHYIDACSDAWLQPTFTFHAYMDAPVHQCKHECIEQPYITQTHTTPHHVNTNTRICTHTPHIRRQFLAHMQTLHERKIHACVHTCNTNAMHSCMHRSIDAPHARTYIFSQRCIVHTTPSNIYMQSRMHTPHAYAYDMHHMHA